MNPEQPEQPVQPAGPKQSDVADKAAERRKRLFDPTGRIEGLTAEETLVADIRRHPFGLFLIYFQIFLALSLSLILVFAFLPSVSDTMGLSKDAVSALAAIFGLFTITFGLVFLALATRI